MSLLDFLCFIEYWKSDFKIKHNQTSRVCWTIHRPFRGWYIRLRSPIFPSGAFIPLTPVPQTSPYHVDASLSFSSRTNPTSPSPGQPELVQRSLAFRDDSSQTSIHSYPPTPTATYLRPLSATSALFKEETSTQTQITQFILAPIGIPSMRQSPTQQSVFFRALSMLKSHSQTYSNSFTLSRVPLNTPLSPPPPYAINLPATDASRPTVNFSQAPTSSSATATSVVPLHAPLLIFHDQTPVLTVRLLTGLLEIEKTEEVLLGVDTSFWVAVALTYLEFLQEREESPFSFKFLSIMTLNVLELSRSYKWLIHGLRIECSSQRAVKDVDKGGEYLYLRQTW